MMFCRSFPGYFTRWVSLSSKFHGEIYHAQCIWQGSCALPLSFQEQWSFFINELSAVLEVRVPRCTLCLFLKEQVSN